jgi:hypothetical protein
MYLQPIIKKNKSKLTMLSLDNLDDFLLVKTDSMSSSLDSPFAIDSVTDKDSPRASFFLETNTPLKTEIQENTKPTNTIDFSECIRIQHVQDQLFWSIFVAKYGYDEYERNKYNYGKIEVQEKQKIANFLNEIGSVKCSKKTNFKLTRVFCCEMVSDLINLPKMPLHTLIAASLYYEMNIIWVDWNSHIYLPFEFISETQTNKTMILYKNPEYNRFNKQSDKQGDKQSDKHGDKHCDNKQSEFLLDIDVTKTTLDIIKSECFKLEHFEKPLKSISNYKKIELEAIAFKTILRENPDNEIKDATSKQELYDRLSIYFADIRKEVR